MRSYYNGVSYVWRHGVGPVASAAVVAAGVGANTLKQGIYGVPKSSGKAAAQPASSQIPSRSVADDQPEAGKRLRW